MFVIIIIKDTTIVYEYNDSNKKKRKQKQNKIAPKWILESGDDKWEYSFPDLCRHPL